jgi:thymidylate synthase
MKSYYDLLEQVMYFGAVRRGRTEEAYRSVFGVNLHFGDINKRFPILLGKKVHWKSVLAEILWVISGSTNIRDLHAFGVTIWDEWADAEGELGPVYGHQLRHWTPEGTIGLDQLARSIALLESDPYSRRNVVSYWNPMEIDRMALPPCHTLFQWFVEEDETVSLHLYMRSCDLFLGLPFNTAGYALLIHMVAKMVGRDAGDLHISIGDAHIYENHIDQVNTLLSRRDSESNGTPRLLVLRRPMTIDGFVADDFRLEDYDPQPAIKAPVAV